ncbi:MAG: ABC transporter ATP-binding protein, partial [Phycisphaerales bacterium]|nr:ABC transporter ATP-binding protein [Phycisphaerales bacterium]
LAECQLTDVARRRIGQLSKGYRQRVALASALLHDPKVLILDEPTNGLDPTQIREARSLIGDLAQNRTVLVSSHILPEIERTCQRVIIIGAGRVLADGTPDELCRSADTGGCIAEIKGHLAAIEFAIKQALPGCSLETAPLEEGWWRCAIRPAPQSEPEATNPQELIGIALASAKCPIRLLRPETTGLEEVFVRVLDEAARNPGGEA